MYINYESFVKKFSVSQEEDWTKRKSYDEKYL